MLVACSLNENINRRLIAARPEGYLIPAGERPNSTKRGLQGGSNWARSQAALSAALFKVCGLFRRRAGEDRAASRRSAKAG